MLTENMSIIRSESKQIIISYVSAYFENEEE